MAINLAFWTDLADGAIMFPLGIAVPIVLGIVGQHRAAIAWTAAVGCVWTVMLVLKLSGYAIAATFPGSLFSTLDLVTPSGHVASSSAIYGGLIGLLLAWPETVLRRSVLAAIVVAIGIGTTRVLLGVHSLSEVIVGAMVGIAGAAGMARAAVPVIERRARLPVLAVTIVIIAAFHGDETSWEDPIHDVALRLIEVWNAHS